MFLCRSIGWKEASCVIAPSLRVSREVPVTPFLAPWLLTTLAVRRKFLTCSLVRLGSSVAVNVTGQIIRAAATASSLSRGNLYIELTSLSCHLDVCFYGTHVKKPELFSFIRTGDPGRTACQGAILKRTSELSPS